MPVLQRLSLLRATATMQLEPASTTDRPPADYDVLIVGAGVAGLSLAWQLSRAGRRVGLVEQGEQPLAEASAQNASMLRRFALDGAERAAACRSYELLHGALPTDLARALGAAEPFRRTGAVIGLASAQTDRTAHLAAAGDLRRRGVRVEELGGEAISRHAPALRDATLELAFWLPDEGLLDAWTLGSALLDATKRAGGRLHLGWQVREILGDGTRATGLRDSRGRTLEAEQIVLAPGAWGQHLAATGAGLERPLIPRARHLLQSAPHPLGHSGDHPWCWIDDAGLYVRPEAGGFLVSPCDETDRYPTPGPGSLRQASEAGRATAQDKLDRYLPSLRGLRLESGWNGLRTFTPSRAPRLGPDPDREGLWWIAGLGGHGVSCALGYAERLALQMLEPDAASRAIGQSFGDQPFGSQSR